MPRLLGSCEVSWGHCALSWQRPSGCHLESPSGTLAETRVECENLGLWCMWDLWVCGLLPQCPSPLCGRRGGCSALVPFSRWSSCSSLLGHRATLLEFLFPAACSFSPPCGGTYGQSRPFTWQEGGASPPSGKLLEFPVGWRTTSLSLNLVQSYCASEQSWPLLRPAGLDECPDPYCCFQGRVQGEPAGLGRRVSMPPASSVLSLSCRSHSLHLRCSASAVRTLLPALLTVGLGQCVTPGELGTVSSQHEPILCHEKFQTCTKVENILLFIRHLEQRLQQFFYVWFICSFFFFPEASSDTSETCHFIHANFRIRI